MTFDTESIKHLPEQSQEWPGRTDELQPVPDHGETSYTGRGRLEGKRALITGGDSGIGRAVAIAFAREGADVAIAHLPEEQEDADSTIARHCSSLRMSPGTSTAVRPASRTWPAVTSASSCSSGR